jgi:hypothetical protein
MPDELEMFMEQLEAAQHVCHHYVCCICGEFEGAVPVVIGIDDGNGVHAVIMTACISCSKGLPDVTKIPAA